MNNIHVCQLIKTLEKMSQFLEVYTGESHNYPMYEAIKSVTLILNK